MSGWIKMHRSMLQWEWFTDVNTCHLFMYLLLEANHKETKWRGKSILPGQILTGRKRLAEITGLSEQNIRTSLERLKSTSEVTSISFSKYSIITITNWQKYQDNYQQPTSNLTSIQPASNQQVTTSNNVRIKECKKIKNIYTPEFENFWNVYGKIGSKDKAAKAFNKIKEEEYEEIRRGIERYNQYCINNQWYYKQHATTWLNGKEWLSDWTSTAKYNKPEQKSKHERAKEALGLSTKSEAIDVTPVTLF